MRAAQTCERRAKQTKRSRDHTQNLPGWTTTTQTRCWKTSRYHTQDLQEALLRHHQWLKLFQVCVKESVNLDSYSQVGQGHSPLNHLSASYFSRHTSTKKSFWITCGSGSFFCILQYQITWQQISIVKVDMKSKLIILAIFLWRFYI